MEWKLRPARDHGLPAEERLRSLSRERGLGSLLLGSAWRAALRGYLAAFHRLQVTGRDHLPPPPFVLIANHSSHLDALTLSAVLRGEAARRAHALAAGDTFFTSTLSSAFAAYAVNALPVWRKRTKSGELATLRERLVEDRLVYILFPEGTRARDGAMAPFQPGIGVLVAGTEVPVVPCFLEGCHAAWPPTRSWPRPGRLRLRIGAPLRFADLPATRAGWEEAARRCEAAVRALSPPVAAAGSPPPVGPSPR
ncbi:1-acyl-sn-glycerol-3-phosphate acyltransferase [Roseomonas eburnea]|uniref:1-acyl-sn-glycerol-3-phosphate acyltransferase n=1 Tax=Neoroseomonas eburnea TaxID=1346889 RepID=A0A9X9XJA2_9PROT|nr:lysophospholipid acyltransferase family protein [Neoroseomonas eburnea]MBR0683788.1 1-acyl-sn-glycerol-3-phosphate acyltransferase [Neoroseomonas eburnea]